MTLNELLNNSPDKLEALSDEELKAILAPYFNVTRPDESKRKPKANKSVVAIEAIKNKTKKQQLDEKLRMLGI